MIWSLPAESLCPRTIESHSLTVSDFRPAIPMMTTTTRIRRRMKSTKIRVRQWFEPDPED
jgi:hypothetical protein